MESKKTGSNLHIPEDIMFNILPRLPPKSLVRFKCVCKSWLSFITQLKYHHRKLFLLSHSSIQSVDLDDEPGKFRAVDLHLPFKPNPPHHRLDMLAIASCNGLLCSAIAGEGFRVWNPFTGGYRRVALAGNYTPSSDYSFGFWYDHPAKGYMIVRLIKFDYSESGSRPPFRSRHSVEIYSQSSNVWQKDQILPKQIVHIETKSGFLVNEVLLYWKTWYRYNRDVLCAILCYDTKHGKFDLILPPDNGKNFEILGDFKRRFCIFSYNDDKGRMDMWTRETRKDRNWLKLLSVPSLGRIHYGFLKPVCFIKNDEILMCVYESGNTFFEGYGVSFFMYSPKTKKYRRVRIPNIMSYSNIKISYVLTNLC